MFISCSPGKEEPQVNYDGGVSYRNPGNTFCPVSFGVLGQKLRSFTFRGETKWVPSIKAHFLLFPRSR